MFSEIIVFQQDLAEIRQFYLFQVLLLYKDQRFIYKSLPMGEVVQIQIGGAGNNIGFEFWDKLRRQHSISLEGRLETEKNTQIGKIDTFFQEQKSSQYRSRAIMVDIDSSIIDKIVTSPITNMMPIQNCFYTNSQTRNLWPLGYNCKQDFRQSLFNSIRKEIQACDSPNGFIINFSACGGAGSGLGSLILQHFQNNYPEKIVLQSILVPSQNLSNCYVESYNTILNFQSVINLQGNPCILYQNEAIFEINSSKKEKYPICYKSYKDIDRLVAQGLVNLTSPFRFLCDGNINLRKMATNMVISPNTKYFIMSMPFSDFERTTNFGKVLKHDILKMSNWSVRFKENKNTKHKWISNYFIFRGGLWNSFDVNYRISQQFNKKVNKYPRVPYHEIHVAKSSPYSNLATVVKSRPNPLETSITNIHNGSEMKQVLGQIQQKLFKLMSKKAFLHHYTGQGVQISQIQQAKNDLFDIISTYDEVIHYLQCYGEEEHYSQCYQ